MYNHSKILALAVLILLPIGLLVSQIPQETETAIEKGQAFFVISGWDFPDEYGQGLYQIEIWENATGSYTLVGISGFEGRSMYTITVGSNIKIKAEFYLNSTLVGVSSVAEGKNYLRSNISISLSGEILFEQNNLTYNYGDNWQGVIYNYGYYVYTDFAAQNGQIYVARITYEVFY